MSQSGSSKRRKKAMSRKGKKARVMTDDEAEAAIRQKWKIVKQETENDRIQFGPFLKRKDFVLRIVGISYRILAFLPDFQDDEEVVHDAVLAMNEDEDEHSVHPTAFQYASERLRKNSDFIKPIRKYLKNEEAKRALTIFDSFVDVETLKELEPISPFWLEHAIKTGDFELFQTQTSILPTRREPLLKWAIAGAEQKPDARPQLSRIIQSLISGEYGVRSLKRLSFAIKGKWLVQFASTQDFNTVTALLRGEPHFITNLARELVFTLQHDNVEEITAKMAHLTAGSQQVLSDVSFILLNDIKRFGDVSRRLFEMYESENSDTIAKKCLQGLFESFELIPRETSTRLLIPAIKQNFIEVVEFLCTLSPQINPSYHGINNDFPAIHFAVVNRNIEMIRLLHNHGADLTIEYQHAGIQTTALHVADDLDVILCLLELQDNSDINKQASNGDTPLHVHIRRSNIVRELLRRGANPSIKNWRGITPVFKSIDNGNITITRLLLNPSYGYDHDTVDNHGNTLLHRYAAATGPNVSLDVCQGLFDVLKPHFATMSPMNNLEESPLMLCVSPRVATILIRHGAGGVLSREGFRKLNASIFDDSPVVLQLKEDRMMANDVTDAPVRCLDCRHVYTASFLHHWLNENKYGYEGSSSQFKTQCPECRAAIARVEIMSTEVAANWDEYEKKACEEETCLEKRLAEFDERAEYKQMILDIERAKQRLKEAEERKAEEDESRKQLREASDAKQRNFRNNRILEKITKLHF